MGLKPLSRLALLMLAAALPAAATPAPQSPAITFARSGLEVTQAGITLRVSALTDSILRVRVAPDGRFPEDASWAVASDIRERMITVQRTENGFSTAALRVRVDPASLRLVVEDRSGKIITADSAEPIRLRSRGFELRKQMAVAERYFGLGDKVGPFDRRGASYVNWNTDIWGYTSSTDPTYKSIPFFVATGAAGGSYGIFLDNSWRSWFNFGHREDGTLAIGSADGPIDYYVIAGPSTAEVVRRYTDLTGKAPLAPPWALGFQQSRYSYMSDSEVREIAGRLRRERVPTDVIWLDIDFQDRNRPFTTNGKTFPDLRKLTGDLRAQGIRLVAITDLHIARAPDQNYVPYDSGLAGNHFVRTRDGRTYVAPVWPGPSVFPDFTRAATRAWWGGLYRDFVEDGIAGFWNDMNEPAIFETPSKTMPADNVHRIDADDFAARDASHAEVHNVYGMENSRATFDGLQRLRPDERPFVMTRASFAGGQRYAVTWTGDNSSTWDHLKLSVQQLLNLGLSGFSYSAADIGGFTGGPSPELLTRWFQIGAFTPVFRAHAANNTPRAEPWVDGPDHLAIRRRFVEERYRLMPYLYGLAELNSRTGDPIMRPPFYDYPGIEAAWCDQSMTFTVGKSLLVAPSGKPESPQTYDICLPAGGWYDYWTGLPVKGVRPASEKRFEVVKETPRLERLPVFVRAGTILPRQPIVQSTAEIPRGPLSLDVYPGDECSGELYFDDGKAAPQTNGNYLRQSVRCTRSGNQLRISFGRRDGRYPPWWKTISVKVHGWHGAGRVRHRGGAIEAQNNKSAQTLSFTVPDQPGVSEITLSPR
jgi:alpha-glucosidase